MVSDQQQYDVIIIGGGPAGLTAALYGGQARHKILLLEKEILGGQIMNVERVENYPGFPGKVPGAQLGSLMTEQAMAYGPQLEMAEVESIGLQENYKLVKANGISYLAKTVIIAGGAHPKQLGVPGEGEFAGRGVIYCAVCDGGQFAEKVVAVAGGGNSGITEALYLTGIASKVLVIEFMQELNAREALREAAMAHQKIEIRCGTRIEAIIGEDRVSGLELLDLKKEERSILEADGVLIRIGLKPNTDYLKDLLSLDDEGYILVDDNMETNVPGIFAAGDIRHGPAKYISTAGADGVVAALAADRLIKSKW
jgi:thioredoxin reductase (NADPH)